ncbi:hypothetical protein ACGFX2_23885 [Streptomyces goshikiensis]|uniref:hypothetical protein n=1 Tax=Streptomyces goshikiensis TaxID=1942 RepID=UPI003718ABBB
MKKYLLAAAVAALVTGTPTAAGAATATAATTAATPAPGTPAGAVAARAAASKAAARVVLPGERVAAGRGWTLWLTRDGKHWSGPDGYENFRSVTDGNLDLSQPGVSHQSESDADGAFHSGVYYGTRGAARVELTDRAGKKTTASLLELPGRPGWGAWYAHTAPAERTGALRVALYDRTGRLLAELPAREF